MFLRVPSQHPETTMQTSLVPQSLLVSHWSRRGQVTPESLTHRLLPLTSRAHRQLPSPPQTAGVLPASLQTTARSSHTNSVAAGVTICAAAPRRARPPNTAPTAPVTKPRRERLVSVRVFVSSSNRYPSTSSPPSAAQRPDAREARNAASSADCRAWTAANGRPSPPWSPNHSTPCPCPRTGRARCAASQSPERPAVRRPPARTRPGSILSPGPRNADRPSRGGPTSVSSDRLSKAVHTIRRSPPEATVRVKLNRSNSRSAE